jgi:CheY-like chemotaxis protein
MNTVEVLLVEDNAGDAVLIRQVLADCPTAVNLHIARDGEQALLMLTDPYFKPHLILLDLNIPRITGLALLERWQSIDIPIVVFSSSLNEAEQKRVVDLGAKEFISKPTDIQAFIDAVCAIVQRWAMPQASGTANAG